MQSFNKSLVAKRNLVGDLIGASLLLVIGITGQILVTDPMEFLAPNLPMLSLQDWSGSDETEQLRILSNLPWQDKREFYIGMAIFNERHSDYDYYAEISQKTTWYADAMKPLAAWNYRNKDFSHMQPISESSLDRNKPTSRLFCRDDLSPNKLSCVYLAYWENWYTEVNFRSDGYEYLSPSGVQRIAAKVEQLLMEAPDEP